MSKAKPKPRMSAAFLYGAMEQAIKKRQGLPHLSDLAEHFVQVAGGPRQVARMMYQEWLAAREGSVVRARILDLLTRVWRFASESQPRVDDLGVLTEADLERELGDLLGSAGVTDALAQEKEAGPEADGHGAGRPAAAPGGPVVAPEAPGAAGG